MEEDRKRNHLNQKDFRRLGDWVLANRALVESLQPEAVAEAASTALGILVTKANAIAACEVVDVLTAKDTTQFTSAKVAELRAMIDDNRRVARSLEMVIHEVLRRLEAIEAKVGIKNKES